MVVATGVGVIQTIAAPGAGPAVFYLDWREGAFGANNYDLRQYYIDAAVNGEGVLRTTWYF